MKVAIYWCGGAGCNIGQEFVPPTDKKGQKGFADVDSWFLDTSESNLRGTKIPKEQIYMVEGRDGGGKVRAYVFDDIAARANDMLLQCPPGDINLIVHSGSGASGSVIGPVLVSELLSRKHAVIAIMVGSSDSQIEAKNTIKTILSYENIATQTRKLPVAMSYYENNKDTPASVVNNKIQAAISLMLAVFSGQNQAIDSADIKHFLNYPAVTSFQPALTRLCFFQKDIVLDKGQAVISALSVGDGKESTSANVLLGYQSTGVLSDAARTVMSDAQFPIHFCMVTGYFHAVIENYENIVRQIDEVHGSIVNKPLYTGRLEQSAGGIIL